MVSQKKKIVNRDVVIILIIFSDILIKKMVDNIRSF